MKKYLTKRELSYKKSKALYKKVHTLRTEKGDWGYVDSPEYEQVIQHCNKEYRDGIPAMHPRCNMYKVDSWYDRDRHILMQNNKIAFLHEEMAMSSDSQVYYKAVADYYKALEAFSTASRISHHLGMKIALEYQRKAVDTLQFFYGLKWAKEMDEDINKMESRI